MNERRLSRLVGLLCTAALAGCAVRPVPDPRDPAPVRDSPWLLRVCLVEGDGAHLAVGDQVEITTNGLGRLRIRHLPARGNQTPAWNGGEDVAIRSAVLVERVDNRTPAATRRFVPVGRFKVRLTEHGEHARFDFLTSKVTMASTNDTYPECRAVVGDDEVLIRGVEEHDRHGGDVHLRYGQ
jgi:hypothetical protein